MLLSLSSGDTQFLAHFAFVNFTVCCKKLLLPSLHQKVPLHLAAGEGRLDMVRYLVEDKEADINVKDDLGVSS